MKIIDITMLSCDAGWRPWLFIKIVTDDGIIGYSECTDSHGSPQGIQGVLNDFKKILIGKDPRHISQLSYEMECSTRQSVGSIIQKVIGGVVNALLDIKAKDLGVPVYELFGGSVRNKIPLYWSHWGTTRVRAFDKVGKNAIKSLKDIKMFVHETKDRGYNAVKTNVIFFDDKPLVYMPGFNKSLGGPDFNLTPKILGQIVEYIVHIRAAGGDDFEIMLDLGFNFKTEGYIRIAQALDPYGVSWIEIDSYDARALRRINDSTHTPIVSGEDLYTLRQFMPYFQNYSMDIASIDVIWNGLPESKKIADVASSFEMNVTPHNYYSHFATFISAHFAAIVTNLKSLEVDIDDVSWKDEIVSEVPKIENGFMSLPHKPGWGIDLNEDELRKYPWKW